MNARNGTSGNARNGTSGNARNGNTCNPNPQCATQSQDSFNECKRQWANNKPVACCINDQTYLCTTESGSVKVSGGNGGRKKQTWITPWVNTK